MDEGISGQFVDIHNETIYPALVHIEKGKIVQIERKETSDPQYIMPGFVDGHFHIESSMLPPSEFARFVIPHGTVATVSDPHEIGNVLGVKGVEYMIENSRYAPLKVYFGVPSCVPATSFETSGATIGVEDVAKLLSKKEIIYLSECMDFPGVIHGTGEILQKIAIAKKLHKRIDGHAPGVTGDDLKKYVAAGIETDHECTTYEEAREKSILGMKILVREGSAARNFDALFPLMKEAPHCCMLCSDDSHPDSLLLGHLNLLVKKAVERGMDVMQVLRCASLNAILHYGLEVGTLKEQDPADFICVDNLKNFTVRKTYIDGVLVAKDKKVLFPRHAPRIVNNFNTSKKDKSDFKIKKQSGQLKVIEAHNGQLITSQLLVDPLIKEDEVVSDVSRDILKITVVNRYQNAPVSVAFIKNFGLKRGAMASSVAHDSHNIVAVGVTDDELCRAVNCIIENKGGIAVVDKDKVECLPLPIAGLMSDLDGEEVGKRYQELEDHAKALGSTLDAPFMTLSFMALLVIPRLKISDKGLFDAKDFALTSLFV